jgi:opacity protein-like surface antigen
MAKGGLYTGVTFGGGLDISLQRNVMLRGEVLWDSYGRKQYTDFSADFSAWTARAAVIWHFQ